MPTRSPTIPAAMRLALSVLLLLTACSDPPAPTPAVAPEAPAVAPAPALEAPAATVPAAVTPEAGPPSPLPVLGGDVVWIDGASDDDRRTLLVRIADEPRPSGPDLGTVEAHQGVIHIRLIAAMPGRYATATITGSDEECVADIVATRRLHGWRENWDDASNHLETTYLAFDFEGCSEGFAGVVGAEATARSLRGEFGEAAPAELAVLAQPLDDAYEDPPSLETYRMLALPERDLRIVRGNGAFVLGQGVRGFGGSLNGMLDVVIEAGYRTFFIVETPSESWLEPLESVVPEIHRVRCVVADASGTPLNVRRLPRTSAEVITTLQNDTEIEALAGPSGWAHVATTPHGWAHASGLRCTEIPPEPWP